MFQTVELGRKTSREEYSQIVPTLREELLQVQRELRHANFPVVLVFAGVDGAGKGETVNILNEWLDPRWLITHAYSEPSQEERERPDYWRYWRDLPPKGRIGMFLRAWYSKPLVQRAYGEISVAEFDERLDRIVAFEDELAQDGALILKFWMHLSRAAQKKRLKKLENDPLQSWQVNETDWRHWHMYDQFITAAERYIMRTSTGSAPWALVEGADARYRSLTVGIAVRDAIRKHLERVDMQQKVEAELATSQRANPPQNSSDSEETNPTAFSPDQKSAGDATILSTLEMSEALPKRKYKRSLKEAQGRLYEVFREAKQFGISSLLVFEGWDAGGKGGAIRRTTAALQAWEYEVIPFAAPTDEENAHHYLWRFWRRLGRVGRVTIFDRSWYGRVLVERVEGFATEAEWRRAYAEINDFEEQLVQHGIVLMKYWIHITADEQLRRFKSREEIPYKRWKLTDEDWRNREKWAEYESAVHDMVQHTSTQLTPWTLVEGNDKRYARVKVLESFREKLEAAVAGAKKPKKKS